MRNLLNEEKAESNPNTFMARLWRWHTGWCPGWKAYQAQLAIQRKPWHMETQSGIAKRKE
jgi:hypothetical protein